MSRSIHRLTAKQAAAFREPGRYSDGGNLYLSIQPGGARRWVFMYRQNGKQREMMLGSADVSTGRSLAEARQLAADARSCLKNGRDPIEERKRAQLTKGASRTFGEYVKSYMERMSGNWRSEISEAQWKMTLTEYCKPLSSIAIDQVDVPAVLKCLQPIWSTKPETARRLRGRIERVLAAAKAEGLRSGENPAAWKGNLEDLLPKQDPLKRKHHGAMSFNLLPAFLQLLRARQSTAALALEFAILTATRTSEVLKADWAEFDLKGKTWTIPRARTKTGKEYRIPLADPALQILEKLKQIGEVGYVFPGQQPKSPLSNMAMLQLLKRMGQTEVTTHGFRSTFRDWGSETTHYPNEVLEMALGHRIRDKAEEAYRRGDLFEKRRRLTDDWAAYCNQVPTANVVNFRKR